MQDAAINRQKIEHLFAMPFLQLQQQAQAVYTKNFPENDMQLSRLCSIKTGRCPEDCAYCPQSGHFNVDLPTHKLMSLAVVKQQIDEAKQSGATRFCMGAAWKYPPKKDFPVVLEMIKLTKQAGLEACVTLGSLDEEQAAALKEAGLDYYNHNLDSSPEYYKKIISTRTYDERLKTLDHVQQADLKVCCGGIIGMGETRKDRIEFLVQLMGLKKAPESIPINRLIAVKGTPLQDCKQIDNFEFIRVIAIARILFPHSRVRISAGRETMSEEMQTLCFICGANSIFLGDKLLTAKNPEIDQDKQLLEKLGIAVNA